MREWYAFSSITELTEIWVEGNFHLFETLNKVIEKGKYSPWYMHTHLEEIATGVALWESLQSIQFDKSSFSKEIYNLLNLKKARVDEILGFIELKTKDIKQEIEACFDELQKIQDICDFEEEIVEIHSLKESVLIFITFPLSEEEADIFITEIGLPLYSLRNLENLQVLSQILSEYNGEISIEIHPKLWDGKSLLEQENASSEIAGLNLLHSKLVKRELWRLELFLDTYWIPSVSTIKDILKICWQLYVLWSPETTFDKEKEPINYEVLRLLYQWYAEGHIQVFFSDIVRFFALELGIDEDYLFSLVGETENGYLQQIIEREFFEFSKEEPLTFHDGWKSEESSVWDEEEEDIDTTFDKFLYLLWWEEDFFIKWNVHTSRLWIDEKTWKSEEFSIIENGVVAFKFPFFTNTNFQKIKKLNNKRNEYRNDSYLSFWYQVNIIETTKKDIWTEFLPKENSEEEEKKIWTYKRENFESLAKLVKQEKTTRNQLLQLIHFVSELYQKNFWIDEETNWKENSSRELLLKMISEREGNTNDILEFVDDIFPVSELELPAICSQKELEIYFTRLLFLMAYTQKTRLGFVDEEATFEELLSNVFELWVKELQMWLIDEIDEDKVTEIVLKAPIISRENYEKLLIVYQMRERITKTMRRVH